MGSKSSASSVSGSTAFAKINSINNDLSLIGTTVYGLKLTFSIPANGSSGNVAKIHLPVGTWIVFFASWHPQASGITTYSGYFNIEDFDASVSSQFPVGLVGLLVVNTEKDYYVKFTNWTNVTVNSRGMHHFNAVRIK